MAYEAAAGGPSPNLKLIGAAGKDLPNSDRAWLAGTYAAIYNTPGACVMAKEWEVWRVVSAQPSKLADWLDLQRAGIPVHSNRRRTHGSPRRLASGLIAAANFVMEDGWERGDDYDRLWSQVQAIPSVGRYFGIKLAGTLHELGLTEAEQYDIRPRGAKNGRQTLALLYPKEMSGGTDYRDGSRRALDDADALARDVMGHLEVHGLHINYFQLEAILCEFNQMVKGSRYPGKTSDADLDQLYRVEDHFGEDHPAVVQTFAARGAVLPDFQLNKKKRKPLLSIYRDEGWVWSDALYEWIDEPGEPRVKDVSLTDWEPLTRPLIARNMELV